MDINDLKEKLNIKEISNEIDELIHILITNLECDIDVSFRKGISYLNTDGNSVFPLFQMKDEDTQLYSDSFLKNLPKSNRLSLHQIFSLSMKHEGLTSKSVYIDSYLRNMNKMGYRVHLKVGGRPTNLSEIISKKQLLASFDLLIIFDLDIELAKSILLKKESKIISFKDFSKSK